MGLMHSRTVVVLLLGTILLTSYHAVHGIPQKYGKLKSFAKKLREIKLTLHKL